VTPGPDLLSSFSALSSRSERVSTGPPGASEPDQALLALSHGRRFKPPYCKHAAGSPTAGFLLDWTPDGGAMAPAGTALARLVELGYSYG